MHDNLSKTSFLTPYQHTTSEVGERQIFKHSWLSASLIRDKVSSNIQNAIFISSTPEPSTIVGWGVVGAAPSTRQQLLFECGCERWKTLIHPWYHFWTRLIEYTPSNSQIHLTRILDRRIPFVYQSQCRDTIRFNVSTLLQPTCIALFEQIDTLSTCSLQTDVTNYPSNRPNTWHSMKQSVPQSRKIDAYVHHFWIFNN